MSDHATIGTMLLSLVTQGETPGLSWQDLDHMVRVRFEERQRHADRRLPDVTDDIWRGHC